MEGLSIEMKKILCLVLPRITTTEIRMLTDREKYFSVLGELRDLQATLETEILEDLERTSTNAS
jgi:hypothetical protein